MSLRWKIFLLGLLVALIVGGVSIVVFSKAWQKLATTYALSAIDLRLKKFDALSLPASGDEWAVEIHKNELNQLSIRWVAKPSELSAQDLSNFASSVFVAVEATRLAEGIFEHKLPWGDQEMRLHLVAFTRVSQQASGYRIVGIESESSLLRLSPWAAPFFGTVLFALIIAVALGYFISRQLNRDYALIEHALGHIGAGRLKDIRFPKSNDPAIRRLSLALESTAQALSEKDSKIAEVSTLAHEDPMTGVPNYRAFENFMEGIMSGAFVPEGIPVLCIVDLDYFKKINDVHGHQVGDFVLKETTRIIQECIRFGTRDGTRSPDFFARYGGEEFVVIFTSVRTDSAHVGAVRILQKIKSTVLKVPSEIASEGVAFDLSVSASIGIAIWDRNSFSREQWVKEADTALYAAKHAGRGRVVQLLPTKKEWLG